MKPGLKICWKGLLLAPAAIPFIYAGVLSCLLTGKHPAWAFLLFLGIGCCISYSATVFLLLPCLYVASRFFRPSLGLTCAVGTVLGILLYLPLVHLEWGASGNDSGPPDVSFGVYLLHDLLTGTVGLCAVAGLLTALLYGLFAHGVFVKEKKPAV